MDKHSESRNVGGSPKAPDKKESAASPTPAPPVGNAERAPKPAESVPDDARKTPLRAAAGDDDAMSKQPEKDNAQRR